MVKRVTQRSKGDCRLLSRQFRLAPARLGSLEYPNNTAGYRPEAAADAWTRLVNFFGKTLK